MALFSHPMAVACPSACSDRGTCNWLTGLCTCVLGWGGPDCALDIMPSCRLNSAIAPAFAHNDTARFSLHYLFSGRTHLERRQHGDPWAAHTVWDKQYSAGHNYVWHSGPRSCACLRELFGLVRFRAPADHSMAYICINTDLHAYLDSPHDSAHNASWRYIDAITLHEAPYKHVMAGRTLPRSDWADDAASTPPSTHAPTLHTRNIVPLSRCAASCSGLGYCTQHAPGSFACACYPELGVAKAGGCEPVRHRHKCVSYCSGRGECIMGFCKCLPGAFGLDCSLALHPNRTEAAVAYNARAGSPLERHVPLFYFADLPAQYTVGYGSGRRIEKFIARSRYRAGDPADAPFQWHLNAEGGALNLAGWRWLEAHNAQFAKSVADRFANWITSQPFDHGFATGSMPGQGWKDSREELAAYGRYVHPNSADRVLMAYSLNERIDGVGAGQKGCFVCFQRDKDIAVPPHPWDMDGAGSTRYSGYVPVKEYSKHSPWRRGVTPDKQWPPRKYLMFFAASSDYWPVSGRPQLKQFSKDPRFLLGGGAYGKPGISTATGMRQATFCYTPFGMYGGYTGRHIHAVLLGCIPVWWVPAKSERSMPFELTLGDIWRNASVTVHERDIGRLPEILESFDAEAIARMRAAMELLWRPMLWSTAGKTLKPIWQEDGKLDAAHNLFLMLARKADLRFNTTLEQRLLATLPDEGVNWK